MGAAVVGFAASRGVTLGADPLGIPIGSQTYPERQQVLDGKFPELMKNMYAAGIRQVELCSPGYREFASLADGKQTRKIIEDNGLKCVSAHFSYPELKNQLPKAIEWAQAVGLTQMGTASLPATVIAGVTSLEEVKRAADEYNKIAATTKKVGIQQFLHNETLENSKLNDGRLTYPVLLEYLDPDLVKMQFQMSSMQTIGNPIMYFRLYPGRFISAHVHGVNLDAPLPPARGDNALVQQVLFNLISNALKFTRHQPAPVLEITARPGDKETIYCVKDNGAGFDMRYVGKLFGVFQRLHLATEFEGTGIGLALVQHIIQRHGGRVWAEGSVNEGAAFYFTLPSGDAEA